MNMHPLLYRHDCIRLSDIRVFIINNQPTTALTGYGCITENIRKTMSESETGFISADIYTKIIPFKAAFVTGIGSKFTL